MHLVLARLLALFDLANSFTIPEVRRDDLLSLGSARFNLIDVRSEKYIDRRGNVESEQSAYSTRGWYKCIVGVGNQSFTLQFDSGSADLWIPEPQTESENPQASMFYEPNSSARPLTGATWSQLYDGGYEASGVVYTDTVTFGSLILQNQLVEVATKTTMIDPVDGIIGLSLGTNGISPPGLPTFLDNIYGVLQEPVFTAKLTRPTENVGFYTLGFIDADTVGGRLIQWTPVVPTEVGSWAFSSTTANIGGTVISLPASNIAVADTGTSLIRINDLVINELYRVLNGSCNTDLTDTPCIFPENAEIPSITLYVGDYGVTLSPQDIVWGTAQGYPGYLIGSVQPRVELASNVDTFGDVWLNNVYAIFDFTSGNQQFGVVARAPGT